MFVSRWIPLTVLCAALVMSACAVIDRAPVKTATDSWSSSDPLSIPHDIRLAYFQKKNLAPNPSFEDGAYTTTGKERTATLSGWTVTDRNIEWADKKSALYTSEEVRHGRFAVKISRDGAGELEEAAGIISDYIPVIPGNYSFTYDVRIQDLSTSKGRLGLKLYDTLTVKTYFYNAAKEPIPSERLNPASGAFIDNSDKSYSFANYWAIEKFPWGTVRGRTYNYPYSEGDLPDQARFVRLFFGLKGQGTVWLDNVDYRYSKWNFTTLERMQPYFRKRLAPEQQLIPAPKQVTFINDVIYWNPQVPQSTPPLVLLPVDPSPAERTAAQLMLNSIGTHLARLAEQDHPPDLDIRIAGTNFSLEDIGNARLVFSIGKTSLFRSRPKDLFENLAPSSGRNRQGYVITSEQKEGALVVYLVGGSPIGSYYAATTAVQLFDADAGIYHNATVVDFPDFLGRSYTFRHWRTDAELRQDLDTIERMSFYKLNKVYAGNNRKKTNWYPPDPLFRRGIQAAGRVCREKGTMALALMVNPYSHFPFEASVDRLGHDARHAWVHGTPESFAHLKNVFEIGLAAGAGTIMFHADDHVPHKGKNRKIYALYAKEDERRFINLQNAQAHVINRLKRWLDNNYPGTRFEFCPPWYANEFIDRSEGRAEVYFKELMSQIPADIAIVWTGPTVRSLSVDMADLNRYATLIHRWPMLWDNTLYARNIESRSYGGYTTHYPGKVRMCNLFEPYDTYRPKEFQKYNDGGHLFMNADAFSEIYRIKLATVADYEWNVSAYDPELSLWKILNKSYGSACAMEILRFNDAYYGLYDMCLRMETMGVRDAELNKGSIFLRKLSGHHRKITELLTEEHPLTGELATLQKKQARKFQKLSRNCPLKSSNE